MASAEDAEWYFEASGVPVGWNARAVGFRLEPLRPFDPFVVGLTAIGAMIISVLQLFSKLFS
jgi:hypothetical protein